MITRRQDPLYASVASAREALVEPGSPELDRASVLGPSGQTSTLRRKRVVFDGDSIRRLLVDLGLYASEEAWTIRDAVRWLADRGITSGFRPIAQEFIVIHERTLLRISPNAFALIQHNSRVISVTVGRIQDARRFSGGGGPILSLFINTAKNVDHLLEGEIADFVAGMVVDTAIGAAAGAAFVTALTGLAGVPLFVPILGAVLVGFVVTTVADHIDQELALRQGLASTLRNFAQQVDENTRHNRQELDRLRRLRPQDLPRLFGAPY